ncbi:MAG TPA: cupin domain-containing protein [Acidimicrobiales bacterium]|nr:cupin domain-containing protein [Acidimicrobiales bacterium]
MLQDEFEAEMREQGRSVSVWANGPGDTYACHRHSYGKILCCLSGSIVFHTDEADIELAAGDRTVLPPGAAHGATVGPHGVRCAEAHVSADR